MALVNGYTTVLDVKVVAGDSDRSDPAVDATYERAIEAASRWIDGHCRRHFWLAAEPSPRLVRPTSRIVLRPGDFPTVAGAVVEVDATGTGAFAPLPTSAWQAEPVAPLYGWPFERITPTAYPGGWPIHGLRPTVRVTAQWGWAQVPKQVEEACLVLALAYVRGVHITGNRTGFEDTDDPVNPLALAEHLLKDFAPWEAAA